MEIKGFTSKIIHTPFSKNDPHGALRVPIYETAAYGFETSEDIELAFKGQKAAHVYSRSTNPTIDYFEQRIKAITGALSVTACASGMAAITNLILTLCKSGDEILTSKHLFGNTFSLFDNTLNSFGINCKYANMNDLSSIEKQITPNTRLIFLETITNPQLEVADIKAISEIAKKHKVLLVTDSSATPPCIINTKQLGVDIEVMSSTKYISGGGTSIGGLIIDNGSYNWANIDKLKPLYDLHGPLAFTVKLKREVYRNIGACLSPNNAYLQAMGLETLVLRVEKSTKNAFDVATWLEKSKKVKSVLYPGLESSPYYAISKKQFNGYPGGIISFNLESASKCFAFMNKLQMIKRATNLNDNKSLIIHPYSTIYSEFNHEQKMQLDVSDTLMRFSLGIEDVEDIIADIEQALI
jgi:O-acetylhomoserine (thiol)-lyase